MQRKYGWQRDLPDHRDIPCLLHLSAAPIPIKVDLRPKMPQVYDQGQLGSCTANAISGAIEYDQLKESKPGYVPSRLFIYYNEREMEGTTESDAGAQIRDGIKSLNTFGYCPESEWVYNQPFDRKPSAGAYLNARQNIVSQYASVPQKAIAIKACLAQSLPVVIGFSVYESFESQSVAQSGVLNLPTADEQCLGGHAVLVVGYDDTTERVIVRNSWGESWGQLGYFTMPYAYLENVKLSADFWVINFV